jgi:hypothetical protein
MWQLVRMLDELPDGSPLRWGVAGDLPGDGRRINLAEVTALAGAVKRLNAWGYTHYLTPPAGWSVRRFTTGNSSWAWGPHNLAAVASAQAAGLTVNLSADHPRQADELAELGIAPVATVLPRRSRGRLVSPAGRRIVVCPASGGSGVTCASCGLCARRDEGRAIVGFPAHGALWRRVDARVRDVA